MQAIMATGNTTANKSTRPIDLTDELAQELYRRVMAGKNLYNICQAKDMPNRDKIYDWLSTNTIFADNYARACKIRREDKFERLEEVADKEEDVQRARLKIDVIKWQLSKEEPRKYGDKMDVTSDGQALQPILVKFIGEDDTKQLN